MDGSVGGDKMHVEYRRGEEVGNEDAVSRIKMSSPEPEVRERDSWEGT
jgi:hypothetical protein